MHCRAASRFAPAALVLAGCLAAAAGPGLLACAPHRTPDVGGVEPIARAWFHASAGPELPAADDPGWRAVSLPDFWSLRRRAQALEGWYRVEFSVPSEDGPWAAAIPGDWEALHVLVNGRAHTEALPQYADLLPTEPDLFVLLPIHDLQPGANVLALRFETAEWRIGSLGVVVVGPAERVRTYNDRQHLTQAVVPTSFAWFALACGAIVALLGRWEETRAAGWFAAGTAAWCLPLVEPIRSLISFGEGFPSSVLLHSFPAFFVIGFHRVLQLERRWLERVLLGTIVAGAALRLAVAPLLVPAVDWLWWALDVGIAVYVLQLALRTRRSGAMPRAGGLLFAGSLGILAGAHDVASVLAGRPLVGFALSPYAPAMLGLATAAALVATLGDRLSAAKRLNLELEQRVEEKRRELAGSYARMTELERGRAIAAERERLMREMHDGTGGQIVSALAMVEGGSFDRAAVGEALRDALADLRMSIDSLDPSEPDLLSLLGAARARLEPRLEASGLRVSWEVRDVARPAHFRPETALQVLRIFQEAVINALRHAQARVLTVRTGEEQDADGAWVFVEVADDGRGYEPGAMDEAGRAGGGRGLGNMRRRAAGIGAQLAVTSGPDGTTVRLRLPREARSL